MTMHIDQAGLELIRREEGCILHPYNDPLNATIGIGHLLHRGQVTDADIKRYRDFTLNDAYALLRGDVTDAEDAIRHAIHVELNQHQWNALVDLVFNCGAGVLDDQVAALINQGRFAEAADAWQAWCHGDNGEIIPDLQRRRANERHLFLAPMPAYIPADELRWETEYDQLRGHNNRWARTRRRALQRRMRTALIAIAKAAQDDGGWDKDDRGPRYHALLSRL